MRDGRRQPRFHCCVPISAIPDPYEEELRTACDNPCTGTLWRVMEIARIDYGCAAFGLVGDEVQVYGINASPHVTFNGMRINAPAAHIAVGGGDVIQGG